MKRNIIAFFILFMLLPVFVAKAEVVDYEYEGYPTIIHSESKEFQDWDPKFWCLHIDTKDGRFINFDYRLAGDTLIQEKHYVRVVFGYEEKEYLYRNDFLFMTAIRPDGEAYADTMYYRQEDDKVFCLRPEGNDEMLILDYGLEVGDEFTDANGEVFVVRETGRQNNNKYLFAYYYYQPKKLILVSTLTGEEDIWIEGIGSKDWGITPYFLMEQNKVFEQLELQPYRGQVLIKYGGNMMLEPHINTENYKAEMIDLTGCHYGDDIYVKYEFIEDTLRVQTVKFFDYFGGYSYAECLIDDGQVDVIIKEYGANNEKRENKYVFDVKIPGFKAGTYQVGMPGGEYVTLECKGTADGIDVVKQGAAGIDKRTYDLQGRLVVGKSQRGLYIQGGRIKATK